MTLEGLSWRARNAIERCLEGRKLSAEALNELCQSEIRSMPNVGAATLKELLAWAAMQGIVVPRWKSSPRRRE